jgi:hypothetical protein
LYCRQCPSHSHALSAVPRQHTIPRQATRAAVGGQCVGESGG